MFDKYVHPTNGAEVTGDDLNLLGEASAGAEDRVLQELVRLRRATGISTEDLDGDLRVTRGILPGGIDRKSGWLENQGIVQPSDQPGTVRVFPFRALIGPRTIYSVDPRASFSDARSVQHLGTSDFGTYTAVELTDSENGRFDLIYATVTLEVAGPVVDRLIKGSQNQVNPLAVSSTEINTITIGKVIGEEQADPEDAPVRPAVPADSTNTYRIPLAYVRVPAGFDASGDVVESRGWIHEVAPTVGLAPQVGGFDLRTATINQSFPTENDVDLTGVADEAPPAYLPSGWRGGVQILACLDKNALSLGQPNIVDDSIDWRRRIGKVTVQASNGANTAWCPTPEAEDVGAEYLPSGRASGEDSYSRMFNTFVQSTGDQEVLFLSPTRGLASGGGTNELLFFVDDVGRLMVTPHAFLGNQRVVLWFEMTSQLQSFR